MRPIFSTYSLRFFLRLIFAVNLWLTQNWVLAQTAALEVVIKSNNGNQTALINQLKTDLSISRLPNDSQPTQTNFLFNRAQQELLNSLRAQGYYDAQVSAKINRNDQITRAEFNVTPGKPVLIHRINLSVVGEGENLPIWQSYRQFDLPLHIGQRLIHANYESTLTDLMNLAHNQGFLDADFTTRQFRVYPHKLQAEIDIQLDTGSNYRFGKIHFSGNKAISDELLNRYVEFAVGDPYTQTQLSALQQSLISSRYFGLVRIEPQFEQSSSRQIPINVTLKDNLPHRYKVGLGFGSDTGARLLFGFENRFFNPQGHRYEIDSVIGERAQSFGINYTLPGERPAKQQWNLRLGWDATQSDNLDRSRTSFTPEYAYQITPKLQLNPYFSLEDERYRYKDQANKTSQLLLVGLKVQNRWVNNETYPAYGYRHNIGIRSASTGVLSVTNFSQLELSSRGVYSIIDFWRILARAQMVMTETDQQENIPSSYRYLLGGENLRGFAFESIGLTDADGNLQGGQNMLSASIETDYRFSKYIGLALFTDAGQVFDQQPTDEYHIGSGVGLRGFTPFGAVRVDLAWAISEQSRPWRLHFSIGLDL